ncbi:MAG: bifunctional SulP family inorganic anion transporter/carbonic anhydrase [Bacteroidetes bacterium]|nr:bifunctional SulP family inorganic anion transporter/carbonic anhydrase [Bacteroidota bacterium]
MNMKTNSFFKHIKHDLPAGLVVYLVALPLCLGIALASTKQPDLLFAGIIAGIIGGIVVGFLSGSQLGVSGPAAGLVTIVFGAISTLGSFEAFLTAVVLAGVLQIIAGFLKVGVIGYYFPSSVIKGMLAAIGIILILKQIPHALGFDEDFLGDESFSQKDGHNTFSELYYAFQHSNTGAVIISIISLALLVFFDLKFMKKLGLFRFLPGALLVVLSGIFLNRGFELWFPEQTLSGKHLVELPVANSPTEFLSFFTLPDFSALANPQVYIIALTLALVASLESLLSTEATDKLDPEKRSTPVNRELKAQGIGNIVSGMIGGLPITQVVVRSSANVNSGGKSKLATVTHGIILLLSVIFIPAYLNLIPLSALAAILIMVGYKLSKPALYLGMAKLGWEQFIPFLATILGVLFTDLLFGIAIGFVFALYFVLRKNFKNAFRFFSESANGKQKITLRLAEEISFLNKASIVHALETIPDESVLIIDGSKSREMDYDVVERIDEFKNYDAPFKKIQLETIGVPELKEVGGFKIMKELKQVVTKMRTQTRRTQTLMTPELALNTLKAGNKRFVENLRAHRNLLEQVNDTSDGQFPFAVVLSCIDSRTSAELIFDLGLGDIFSVRVAGNVVNEDILGSMEYACKVAGSKLIVVLGHSKCGAVISACNCVEMGNVTALLSKIQPSVKRVSKKYTDIGSEEAVQSVAAENVHESIRAIRVQSPILQELITSGEVGIVGAMYDVESGRVEFFES